MRDVPEELLHRRRGLGAPAIRAAVMPVGGVHPPLQPGVTPGVHDPVRAGNDHVDEISEDHPRGERGGPAPVTLQDHYLVGRHGYAVSSFTAYDLIRMIKR